MTWFAIEQGVVGYGNEAIGHPIVHLIADRLLRPLDKIMALVWRTLNENSIFSSRADIFRTTSSLIFASLTCLPSAALAIVGVLLKSFPLLGSPLLRVEGGSEGQDFEDMLSIASYNTALMPYETINAINRMRPAPAREEEISQILHEIDASVVFSQECFGSIPTLRGVFPYAVYEAGPTRYFLNSGLAIFCKHRISNASFRPYRNGTGMDACANKGLLGALIDLGSQRYVLGYTTHLQSGMGEQDIRDEQLTMVREWMGEDIQKINGSTHTIVAIILAGDFNDTHAVHQHFAVDDLFGEEFQLLNDAIINDDNLPSTAYDRATLASSWGDVDWSNNRLLEEQNTIDHILIWTRGAFLDNSLTIIKRPELAVTHQLTSGSSDHIPIVRMASSQRI